MVRPDAGANAGVELPITVGPSPIKGEATLDDAKAADLTAGKWYVNIHTKDNPMGEIPRPGRAEEIRER